MKRFALMVAFLALGGFVLGCGGEKDKDKKPADDKKPAVEEKKPADETPAPAPTEDEGEKKPADAPAP